MSTQTRNTDAARIAAPADGARVSVVIPAYNASAFLAATLQTIREQSVQPGEVFVIDDGSSDDTAAIGRSFEGVTVISVENGGPAAARNAGVLAAGGDYIAFLDADDLWHPDKLAIQLGALESYPEPAFSFTDYRLFDERGFWKRSGELLRHRAFRRVAGRTKGRDRVVIANGGIEPVLYDASYIAPSSVLVRRADLLAIGGFNEALRYCEDYDLFLRLFNLLPAVVLLQPMLLYYRVHPGQGTKKTALLMKAAHFDVAALAAAAPERYPRGDVAYLARTDYLREYTMAVTHARRGQLDEAVNRLERSVAARRTLKASILLFGARLCRSRAGRRAFDAARALWKRRPGPRHEGDAGKTGSAT